MAHKTRVIRKEVLWLVILLCGAASAKEYKPNYRKDTGTCCPKASPEQVETERTARVQSALSLSKLGSGMNRAAPAKRDMEDEAIFVDLRVEDGAPLPGKLVATFHQQHPTHVELLTPRLKKKVETGVNEIDVDGLPEGTYFVSIEGDGRFATQWRRARVWGNQFKFDDNSRTQVVTLYRKRYVTIRYVVNTSNQRNLAPGSAGVTAMGTLVVAHGERPPEFLQNWRVVQYQADGLQTGPTAMLTNQRQGGFATAARGADFERLNTAPAANRYRTAPVEVRPGTILFCRGLDENGDGKYFGKLLVEAVSVDPPTGAGN